MSKIAVLIPSYKPGDYVERCFESIEKQNLSKEDYKVYVALNGSRENHEKYLKSLLASFSFKYEFFCLSETGVSNARNHLINKSSEPFITFIDDDDCVSSKYLSGLLSVTTNVTMGVSDMRAFNESIEESYPNFIGVAFGALKEIERSHLRARKFFSSPCAKMLHRDIIDNIRFDERLANGEDSLFMATISKNINTIKKAPLDSCYYVYKRANSASRTKPEIIVEMKRIAYITYRYSQLFFRKGYDKTFMLNRILATFKNLKRFYN